jgi:hypothetical protein
MQGHLFFNQDNSLRGKFGHIDQRQKWCVKCSDGRSYHIDSRLLGFTASADRDERPKRQTVVTVCDGSCQHSNEIPNEIWNEANAQITSFQKLRGTECALLTDIAIEQIDSIHSTGGYQGA